MATLASTYVGQPVKLGFNAMARIYAKETKYEFLKLLRTRTFSLSMIGFPLMFYVLFGVSNKGMQHGVEVAKYMLAGYCCFGMVGAALFGIGVGLATEKGLGWLELKRASPMPASAYLFAKCVTAQAFGVIIVAVLALVGVLFGGVHLTVTELAMMFGMAILGTIPFVALGLMLALLVPANAATGVINLIYLPMSFMSGLWIPLNSLPTWLQKVAPVTPTYHLNQLMLTVFGYQNQERSIAGHWYALVLTTVVLLGISWRIFQRAEQNA